MLKQRAPWPIAIKESQFCVDLATMVDSIKPTHSTIPSRSASRKEQNSPPVESHGDKKQPKQPVPPKAVKERRKHSDRREREQTGSRAVYELRSGKVRRKNDRGHPSIEIDV